MSLIGLRAPLYLSPTLQPTVADRKRSIRGFGARLKMMHWLTIPRNVFPEVPEHGLALFPTKPAIEWRWDIGSIIDWRSDSLIWIGLWRPSLFYYPSPR